MRDITPETAVKRHWDRAICDHVGRMSVVVLSLVLMIGVITVGAAATVGATSGPSEMPVMDHPGAALSDSNQAPAAVTISSLANRSADEPSPPENKSENTPKISDRLEREDHVKTEGTSGLVEVTIRVNPRARVDVVNYIEQETRGTVLGQAGGAIDAEVSRDQLGLIADRSGVRFIEPILPVQQTDSVESEGLDLINAPEKHARGQTGEGITVAVIDFGFNTSNPEVADNVVGTKNYTRQKFDSSSQHGTAVSELVVDVAPDVNLVLIKARTGTQIAQGTAWAADRSDVDLIVHSLSVPGLRLDGKDYLSNATSYAVNRRDVPLITSAGNEAQNHWNGTYVDNNGNNLTEFQSGREVLRIEARSSLTEVSVQWRDWPTTNQDYDVHLYNQSGSIVDRGAELQDGAAPPIETVGPQSGGTHYLVIQNFNASGDANFDIFVDGGFIPNATATRSITVPATAESSLAIGAYDVDPLRLAPYSSQGPTVDGRQGVDVVAPTEVSTVANSNFGGTSAAAPHAAGVAALVFGANDSLSAAELYERLRQTAYQPPGDTSSRPDPAFGHGMIDAYGAVPPQNPNATIVDVPVINRSTITAVPVTVRYPQPPLVGETLVLGQVVHPNGTAIVDRGTVQASNTTSRATQLNLNLTAAAVRNGTLVVGSAARNGAGVVATDRLTALSTVPVDTVRPDVENAKLGVSPVIDDDTGNAIDVRVNFTERVDTTMSPSVTVDTPNASYEAAAPSDPGYGWVDETTWVGTVSFEQRADRGTVTALITNVTDTAGNDLNGSLNSAVAGSIDTNASEIALLNATDAVGAPGENVTVEFDLMNTGTENQSYILNVSTPTNVSIVDQYPDSGTWSANNTAWLWRTVSAGDSVRPNLTVKIPEKATGTLSIAAVAKANNRVVDSSTATVSVCASIPEAIDSNNDGKIGDFEVLDGINSWRDSSEVPNTCGKTISDFEVLDLIETWRTNSDV